MKPTTRPFDADCAARLHILGGAHRFVVILPPPGGLSVVLTHDAGVSWPDRRGEALAREVLAEGGTVALGFATLGDALACQQRIRRGRR
jgi:hypothetical protein